MSRAKGFTLVELMISLLVAALLTVVAVPSFKTFIENNRLATAANSLVSATQYARTEAVKRGQTVSVVATGGAASDEWGAGWEVQDSGGTVLRAGEGVDGATIDSTGGVSTLNYDASGFVDSNDTINVCIATGREGRQIRLTLSGRTYVSKLASCP
ncbi:MAG: prepilin-type N-terminal cleavage/methylation domain-containing protein [Gammaproteobacteria bacterium]|nr:prepilin-type N-terminal cleavage/methylation domain-containing protein [Gammaproteobacteria bacterium]